MGSIPKKNGTVKGTGKIVLVEDKFDNNVGKEEVPESQKILFETTYSNMNECGKKGSGKYVVSIPIELLKVDFDYQRITTSTPKRLRKLANHWTEDKLMPIIVVPHPEEYCFYIVDGYHRFTVVTKLLDIKYKSLDAIVLTNVPKDPSERKIYEASLFVSQNEEVERVTPVQMHKARLLIGDSAARNLQDILDKYNVAYTSSSGQRGQSVLGSYDMAYQIVKRHGRSCLEFIFSIIENAGWKTESNGYSKTIMKGIQDVWCAYPTSEKHIQMYTYYSKVLRKTDPKGVISKSRSKYSERDDKQVVALYLADMLIENLGFEKTKYFEKPKIA